jgi:hypothetical protein
MNIILKFGLVDGGSNYIVPMGSQSGILFLPLQLSLTEQDNITPITLLHNSAAHLLGPSRTLGAIMCGYSGIRFFEPQVRV